MTSTTISTAPLAVGEQVPLNVPVTRTMLVIVAPCVAGIPMTDVVLIEQAISIQTSFLRQIQARRTTISFEKSSPACQANSPQVKIADSNSRNAVSFFIGAHNKSGQRP
jgi:hypothetical protein